MSNEEREGEEKNLGELPEGLFREREGRFPQTPLAPRYARGQRVPPDINYQDNALEQARGGKLGSPNLNVDVRSVFDARPINARDFLQSGINYINTVTENKTFSSLFFTVPEGYTCILRGVKYSLNVQDGLSTNVVSGLPGERGAPNNGEFFMPEADESLGCNFFLSVLINGSAQPDYTDVPQVNIWQNDFLPAYIIAEAGQIVELRLGLLRLTDALDTLTSEMTAYVSMGMRGNLLLSRGLPANLEPGNIE